MEGRQGSISSANAWMPNSLRQHRSTSVDVLQQDEHSSLLTRPNSEARDDFHFEDEKSKTQLILHEFWVLLRGSLPVIVAYTLQNSLQTVSVLIVGRLSPEALATAAFAYMFAMATGWLIALGGTTAIDTLASATFTGSKNPHDLGVILQRAFVVLTIFYIPIVILWICAEPIFIALGQETYLARDAARFLTVLAPGGLGYIYFECLKKYLQAQGRYWHFEIQTELTILDRNHETRHLRFAHYIAFDCWSQLFVCLYIQYGTSWSTACYGYRLLG
jgi:MATE family multidrug resistance protein